MSFFKAIINYILSLENKCFFCHYEILDISENRYLCKICYENLLVDMECISSDVFDQYYYVLMENRFILDKLNLYINNNKNYYLRVFVDLIIRLIEEKELIKDVDYLYYLPINYNSYYDPSLLLAKKISSRTGLELMDDSKAYNLNDKIVLIISISYLEKEHKKSIVRLKNNNLKTIKFIELVHKN